MTGKKNEEINDTFEVDDYYGSGCVG